MRVDIHRILTDQEIRMWCVEQCNRREGCGFFMEEVITLYEFITGHALPEESKELQK